MLEELLGQLNGGDNYIYNCKNSATIVVNCEKTYTGVGGICGVVTNDSSFSVINCYNSGELTRTIGKSSIHNYETGAGGIIGVVRGTSPVVKVYNSYNLGNCYGSSGGIVGTTFSGETTVINCYNAGSTDYGILYRTFSTYLDEFAYYLDISSNSGGYSSSSSSVSISEEKMKSQDFVDELNSNIETLSSELDTLNWKNWILGDDGYPTFE